MKRAKIDRRIHEETRRNGLLGLWLCHTLTKSKREIRRKNKPGGVVPLAGTTSGR